MGRIDLHIHTLYSDGVLTPFEVVDEAVKNKVECIAITDHDTISAYSPELEEYAKKKGILIIPAVEISAKRKKIWFHILGYNIVFSNSHFQESLLKLKNARYQYLFDVVKKLNMHGYDLNIDELNQIDIVTKAHIAQNVVENPKNKNLLLNEFLHIPQKGEFIEKIMNENCPCYVEKYTISLKDAVDLIKVCWGFPVLAHPMAYQYENNILEDKILELIQETGIAAIEWNYVYVDKDWNKHNDTKKWNMFAEKYNLLSTVWSDFHFFDGVRPEIGLIHENLEHIDSNFIIKEIIKNSH